MQIRDNRLYREHYGTFEEYCKGKWGLERRRAYQLIDGYKVSENVNARTQTEYQLRPLTKIKDPEEQREKNFHRYSKKFWHIAFPIYGYKKRG